MAWPPGGWHSRLVINGFIDRLDQDAAGQWHRLDFKTNRVTASGIARQAAAYEMQMLVYALAAEEILGVAPHGLTLHFCALAPNTFSSGTPRLAGGT